MIMLEPNLFASPRAPQIIKYRVELTLIDGTSHEFICYDWPKMERGDIIIWSVVDGAQELHFLATGKWATCKARELRGVEAVEAEKASTAK